MAAAAVIAGHRVQDEGVASGIHGVQVNQRGVQAIKPAEIEQAVLAAWLRQGQRAAQAGAIGIAVGLHRRHAIQRAAQDDDDEAFLRRRGAQRQRGTAQREGGRQA
jgi:hypothetical protein